MSTQEKEEEEDTQERRHRNSVVRFSRSIESLGDVVLFKGKTEASHTHRNQQLCASTRATTQETVAQGCLPRLETYLCVALTLLHVRSCLSQPLSLVAQNDITPTSMFSSK